ncbi:metal-dependent amidase/aminoacylase/carboxypeptidase [Polychaeton citri CBS 116435]|uniref:Metal-dependent amidase/aminoacylase/carboxypeptidase n=1 Tax=Polychaeton citri CBS 116435 TaxID=1314669 RepID=A0A9P4QE44_9PEZI|nr:metal-dependent amidase/aminoacylase/carboxypeptidase [Polychaeton citri CBS 116435]
MSERISSIVQEHRPDLAYFKDLYKYFHQNPELSNQEKETAARVVEELGKISSDFEIKSNIGGYGLVAILRSNIPDGGEEKHSAPIVLLRADFDALPVEEKTGLDYASTKRMKNTEGVEKPVMHACGHDMHITSLLGAATLLISAKSEWKGTLILLFQPAEERGTGARAMVDDGLYDPQRHGVPVPDIVLGAHVMPLRAGTVGTRRGLAASSADSLRVTLYGRGAHASQPHTAVDPVTMAASTIMKLQTIVSREVAPGAGAVVTVAAVSAGDAENVIADDARLSIDTRALDQKTRDQVMASIRRIVRAESLAGNAVADPTFQITRDFPLTINDADVTARLEDTFAKHFGEGEHDYTRDVPRLGGSEDFPILGTAVNRPVSFWQYGGTDPALWDKAEKDGVLESTIPINHSAKFAPVIMPTLQCALDAYALAALSWLAA